MYGVRSKSGIVTIAPKGEEQAREWAAYEHTGPIGDVGEVVVAKLAKGWVEL